MTCRVRPGPTGSGRARPEHGAVTAETAMVLPVLVVLTVALAWVVGLGVAQVRTVDAAREAARALARSDPEAQALGLGRRIAPDGARISVRRGEGLVTVRVEARIDGPGGVLADVVGVDLSAEAVALAEDTRP